MLAVVVPGVGETWKGIMSPGCCEPLGGRGGRSAAGGAEALGDRRPGQRVSRTANLLGALSLMAGDRSMSPREKLAHAQFTREYSEQIGRTRQALGAGHPLPGSVT